ncbi:Helicase associated domain protein, partial [Luminiphilus sp.]|nr:Helicase associated domain protein [Luminiphilus sp.]
MATFRDFKSSFPEDNHAKGKAFEGFLGDWFFKNHPLYRHKFVKVWQWADWPKPDGVAAQDLGTDLIAEDTEGKICAIQAKFYDVDSSIKFKDISTFLADSSKDYVDYRLLIGTAELAPNARKQLQSQQKPAQTFLLHDFDAWDYDWPKSLAGIKKAPIKEPHEARPHQQAAIDDVCFKLDGRGQLIMACGTGKTLTGQRITEALKSETTLVLLPSLLLLSGTMSEWLQHTKVGFHYLPVCSDASIGGKAAPETNFTSGELGNASTTDPDEIRAFLKQKGNKVIFSTYQSSGRVAEAIQGTATCFDLILADEAHRCAGKVAADYGYVLDEKKLPARNRLFMTATPRIYKSNVKKAAKDADIQIASMDDETVFGPVVHHLTFGQAIDQKLLTDYQVVVVGVNDAAVDEMVEERALVKTEAGLERDAATLGSQLGLMKAVRKYDLQRVITFHSRINQARDYAAEFQEVIDATKPAERPTGTITYSHVSGAMPTVERTNKLRALGLLEHEDRYLLGNARCLSEGVDVPALDGVAFVDPRRSEIDIIQAVGRAIRKSSNKTKGTIIIPVFIAEGDDPDEVLSSSAFDQVWKVVNALRAHDEKLGEELDQIRRAEGRGERVSIEDTKLIFDVHESVGESFLQAFETKLVEATTASWEFWFGLLEHYIAEHGDCLVPERYVSQSGLTLGRWVRSQRERAITLSAERVDRLNSIGFIWDPMEQQWEKGFTELERYYAEYGDCAVPYNHLSGSGFKLGAWVVNNRNGSITITQEKLDRLNSIGFIWDPLQQQWEEGFTELERYYAEYGDCMVPQRYATPSGFNLGNWVSTQRVAATTLSKERVDRLNRIGFIWDPYEQQWEEGFSALKQYYAEHGDCLVPQKYVTPSDLKLGRWVRSQRASAATLSKERLDRLNRI